jgi:hypothetical protein
LFALPSLVAVPGAIAAFRFRGPIGFSWSRWGFALVSLLLLERLSDSPEDPLDAAARERSQRLARIERAQRHADDEASERLREALAKGRAALQSGEFDRAEARFNEAVVIAPTDPAVYEGLRAAYLRKPLQDRRPQAKALHDMAIRATDRFRRRMEAEKVERE